MHFGYLNRNYAQELADSDRPRQQHGARRSGPRAADILRDADQPQPLHRVGAEGFRHEGIDLDADRQRQDAKRLTAGSRPEWEIDPAGGASLGGQQSAEARRNTAPTITVLAVGSVAAGASTKLVANVTDDGLPKPTPEKKAAVGQETPPHSPGRRRRARQRAGGRRCDAWWRPKTSGPDGHLDRLAWPGQRVVRAARLPRQGRHSRDARRLRQSLATTSCERAPAIASSPPTAK